MIEAVEHLPAEAEHDFPFTYSRPEQPLWQRLLIRSIEAATGARHFERLYRDWSASPPRGETIFAAGLRKLGIDIEFDGLGWPDIPRSGPQLIIANHPFGVIDGLALAHFATMLRPDMKIMVHSLLCRPPEAEDYLLPVDFGPTAEARATTMATCRKALSWLSDGHCLVMFPGGSISTRQHPFRGHASDPAWYPLLGLLAEVRDLNILPVYFHGENSLLFQAASQVHYALRIAVVFRESKRLAGKPIRMTIGRPVSSRELAALSGRGEKISFLRRRCYELAGAGGPSPDLEYRFPKHISWE